MNAWRRILFPFWPMVAAVAGTHAGAATLHVGAASCDITSKEP